MIIGVNVGSKMGSAIIQFYDESVAISRKMIKICIGNGHLMLFLYLSSYERKRDITSRNRVYRLLRIQTQFSLI